MPPTIYAYIRQTSRKRQLLICALTAVIAPLMMAPLEFQRRIVDHALGDRSTSLLLLLGGGYLAVVLIQNGLKYWLNMEKGRVLEETARDLRRRVLDRAERIGRNDPDGIDADVDEGTTVSMLAAESEVVGGFASESLSVPLLQLGTILFVAGYLLWVSPLIAAFAALVYLPQVIVVPRVQAAINRLTRMRTWKVRKLGRDAVEVERSTVERRIEERRRAEILIEQVLSTRMRIYTRKFFVTFFGNVLDALGPIVVLVLGGWLVIQGRTEVSTLVVFISGFQKIASPWDQLVNFYRTQQNAKIAYGVMAETLSDRDEATPRADASAPSDDARRRSQTPPVRSEARSRPA
jgi:ABC-type multidrug transport system fused ATPase/permease subunit